MPRVYQDSDYQQKDYGVDDWRTLWWAPDSALNVDARRDRAKRQRKEAERIALADKHRAEALAARHERHRRFTVFEQLAENERVEAVLRLQMHHLKSARKRIARFKPLIGTNAHLFERYDEALQEEERLARAIPLLRAELRACKELLAEVEADPELLFHVEMNMETRL